MKLKAFLSYFLTAGLLSLSSTTNAQFDFGGPFDMFDNDDDYNSYRDGGRRGYGRDRWRRYDEWEPNYWRYRFFDDDSEDYIFDNFDGGDFFDDGNFFGDGRGRGRFNFDMDMGSDFGGNYDGRYDDNYRYRGDRYRRGQGYRRDDGYRAYDQPPGRNDGYRGYDGGRENFRSGSRYNNDRYNDDYWRDYSRQNGGGSRSNPRAVDPRRR